MRQRSTPDNGKRVRCSASLPVELNNKIRKRAIDEHRTVSELVTEALERYLAEQRTARK
jgi:metal-responsive CopG/Arc/MetJ family transcriptional regulator